MAPLVAYFSSRSENTHRFVARLGAEAFRIPLAASAPAPAAGRAFVLVTPTYAGDGGKGAVPKPVIRFLNEPANRALLRGVVAGGNTNFGSTYALAGDVVSRKCGVPVLHRFELLGTDEDVAFVKHVLETLWKDTK